VLLLDTPPALGFALTSALLAAGWAILPTATTQQDFDALIDTLGAMDELAAEDLPCAVRLAILPNSLLRHRPDLGGLEALRQAYGDLVATPVPNASGIKRALNHRLPLSQMEPDAAAMTAYRDLAQRVIGAVSRTAVQETIGA
jgi:cellulose biosynthesis protein BcsQ